VFGCRDRPRLPWPFLSHSSMFPRPRFFADFMYLYEVGLACPRVASGFRMHASHAPCATCNTIDRVFEMFVVAIELHALRTLKPHCHVLVKHCVRADCLLHEMFE